MAAKRFHIAKPEELRELDPYRKEGRLDSFIRVWMTALRKDGVCRWDNAVYAYFSGDRHREAKVYRIGTQNELIFCATLQYSKALKWCEEHLKEVQT